ncbi:MAG: P-II family nitrogen regulator [Gammaproteobacteria bacterium]|nr:P-II family nitrogen regulator [Gammaproteobacteria bacterium]
MHFKLIIALVEDAKTDVIMDAAREAGATGATVLNQARGEGIQAARTFLGLNLESQRDMLMFLVEEHMSRHILESIASIGDFESNPGAGIAFQIDVEDAVGVSRQVSELSKAVEDQL